MLEWLSQIKPEFFFGLPAGAGLFYVMWKKFLTTISKQEGEQSAYSAMEGTVKALQEENSRLHKTVLELQGEVAKLHVVIAELTQKLTVLSISSENQKVLDDLAREGKIDRRHRGT